jgi:hypothetical protein
MNRCLFAVVFLLASPVLAGESFLLPPDARVAGKTQEEWSREWWQWAGSFQWNASPVADESGALCTNGQRGDVWFLAGTYDTGRTIRTCTVPRGKYLFFPLVNYMVMPRENSLATCEDMARKAALITDGAQRLVLEIDGHVYGDLLQHRLPTRECFDLGARATPPARVYPTAGNGYYVMLRPLPPGKHEINFGGILPSMLQAVTYALVVE